jgi:hypothetical protein
VTQTSESQPADRPSKQAVSSSRPTTVGESSRERERRIADLAAEEQYLWLSMA